MFPFDVILFDIGGVLLTNGWDHRERAVVLERFHVDIVEFERRHPEPYNKWESGTISAEEYLDTTVFYERRNFTRDEFMAAICAQSVALPNGALGIVQELAASRRAMLGCLNNEARETNEFRFREFGLRKYFEVALSSCYLGVRKPDAVMYQRALDILGRPPQRILFIDDREGNVAAAAAAGLKAIRFRGADLLRQELEYLTVF